MIPMEDVFKTSGIPTYTFVKPDEYTKLLVSLRTKGRGLVIEGPSGIGKTTSITKAIEDLKYNQKVTRLSARKKEDNDYIKLIPDLDKTGTVIVDDFHVLSDETKKLLADYLKTLADEESENVKLILIGINKAGDSLVKFAADLNNRIDTIKFEINPDEKVAELITKGEEALKINIKTKQEIVTLSKGSFHIAQMLCKETCLIDDVSRDQKEKKDIGNSIEVVKEKVLSELSRTFYPVARDFAIGSRIRREGRAPYLHLLNWLAESDDWTIQMGDVLTSHPELKGSVGQIIEKGFLEKLISENEQIQNVIHYDSNSQVLSIGDPKFFFYIRNLLWNKFAKQVGFIGIKFGSRYDFALSFAGSTRDLVELITDLLLENQVEVFYDRNEQHSILASNIEDYLAPIYKSEAKYIIALLSKDYPKRVWTKFESEQFKQRFGENSVIPIWYSDCEPGIFDESTKVGGITFDLTSDIKSEAKRIVDLILKKLSEERSIEQKEAEE